MSEPARFGPGSPGPRPDHCGGALVRVTGHELHDLQRSGVVFARTFKDGNGIVLARARCNDLVHTQRIEDPSEDPREAPRVREIPLGLCSSCSALEAHVRRTRKALRK